MRGGNDVGAEGEPRTDKWVPGAKKRNIVGAMKDLFSKHQGFKVVFAVVLVTLAITRFFFYEALSTRMDLTFLALVLAVFLLLIIPWEQFWERLSGFNVGGFAISLQQPDVQGAIRGLTIEEETLQITGSSDSEEVKDRLRRQLKILEGELQTIRGSRVLWIDDEPQSILGERRLLRALGIDITPARSSERACEILKEDHDFDLIISDTLRDGRRGEGVDFIVELRRGKGDEQDEHIKNLPVIFYAADRWDTVKEVTRPARELDPGAEISNSVDSFIPKVIRMLFEARRKPTPVSAKKTSPKYGQRESE